MRVERPSGGGKTLYISGIPSCLSREEKWGALHTEFSRHGLVYDVSLPLSPANQEPISDVAGGVASGETTALEREYGFVTFYSLLDAKRALREILKSPINVGSHMLKVELARPRNKPRPATPTSSRLFLSQCRELCNHFLGFNGWSLHIISMETIEEEKEGGRKVWVGVHCRVGVRLRECGEREICGEGEWRGEDGDIGEEVRERLRIRGIARKIAFSRACEDAFSDILIVLVPGRPAVPMIVSRPDDQGRQLVEELVCSCPPVTVLPCQPDDSDIMQECPW